MELTNEVSNGVHRLDIRVYYEDTDFSGLVYHANYLKFCERGRSEMLRLAGVHHNELALEGLHFVVRRMECEFRAAARIDDVLQVETRVQQISGARCVLAQALRKENQVLFEADVTVALVDGHGKPQRISAELTNMLK